MRIVEVHAFARPNRETPLPKTDYQKAEQKWDDRMASARPGHEPAPVACCLLLAAGLAGGPVWQTARRTPPLGSTDRQGVGQAQRWRRQTPGSAGRPADRLSPRSLEAEHGLPACKATQTSGVGEDLPCSISADLDWKTVVPRRRRMLRACRPPPSSPG